VEQTESECTQPAHQGVIPSHGACQDHAENVGLTRAQVEALRRSQIATGSQKHRARGSPQREPRQLLTATAISR
jgi:hypothetical protein